jgi:peptidyl-prolyl cis-trans isomerase C
MTYLIRFMAVFSLSIMSITAIPSGARGQGAGQTVGADRVVARVNGTEITLGHMMVLRENLPAQYQSLPMDVLFNGLLEQLIQQTALEKTMQGKLSKLDILSMENFSRSYVANSALQGVVSNVATPQALQLAYDTRVASMAEKTEYRAAHILVASIDEAEALKAELDAGADFAELASRSSTDTGSGTEGGELGWFSVGTMVAPFEAAVVSMNVGAVSSPVQTDFGWHLIKLQETRIQTAPSLQEMTPELTAELEQKAVDAYLLTLLNGVNVEKDVEGLDPNLLNDTTLLQN